MKKLILFLSFISGLSVYAQGPELSYTDITQLGNISEEDNVSDEVIRSAAYTLFNNRECEKAYHYFKRLILNKSEVPEDYYCFSQCLKVKEQYGTAEYYMSVYAKKTGKSYSEILEETYLLDISQNANKYSVQNLEINSKYSEFPCKAEDNTIVFLSDRKWKDSRAYKLHRGSYGVWQGSVINEAEVENIIESSDKADKYIESGRAISPDGMFSFHTENDTKTLQLKIIRSRLVDGSWKPEEKVHFCADYHSVAHPTFSPDGKQLYFVSNMAGGFGETDIYVCDVNEDGTLGAPENLGPNINTLAKESFPFVDKNGQLYFASSGHNTLGGFDIFQCELDVYNDSFKKAENLGQPINSRFDDFAYVEKDGNSGFFASNREDGQGKDDIYSFSRIEFTSQKEDFIESLKTLTQELDLENSGIPSIEVNENGTYSPIETQVKQGKYYLIAKNAKGESGSRKVLSPVYLSEDGTYTFNDQTVSGTYYVIEEEPQLVIQSDMILKTIKTSTDGSFNYQEQIEAGDYYLVSKNKSFSDSIRNSLNQIEFSVDGSYKTETALITDTYFLIPETTAWISDSEMALPKIELLDNGTYMPENLISNGRFYLLPKDVTLWFSLMLNYEQVSINSDSTYVCSDPIEEDVYYVIPKEKLPKENAFMMNIGSEQSGITFDDKSLYLTSDSQLRLINMVIYLAQNPESSIQLESSMELTEANHLSLALLRKRFIKIEEFLIRHGVSKERINWEEVYQNKTSMTSTEDETTISNVDETRAVRFKFKK